jgi:hypothetical protein
MSSNVREDSSLSSKKTFHKTAPPKKPVNNPKFKSPFTSLLNSWLGLPPRVRLYIGGSTFLVVFVADKYLTYTEEGTTEKIYDTDLKV